MKLIEYFDKHNINPLVFASQVGLSITSIYRYLEGKKPLKRNAMRISRFTGGEVTVEELLRGENGKAQ